ncbi:putative transcription factor interactor and regulator CCHC(Zn) family [Lupinus albus]|uniref:Putative transcription factor interactor and regulator CCHC(Zn) family n=1 Tax=Lupinus albus TaxID=3870 RepID=A0A6A4QAK3_LUPAL|nr:putative transcription factor interactor and regulator CCHC(Zn) family [Lupinus albus]
MANNKPLIPWFFLSNNDDLHINTKLPTKAISYSMLDQSLGASSSVLEYYDHFLHCRRVGTPISLDEATSSHSFGHFAKILVDIDLKSDLPNQILVEREGYAFFVSIEYDNLPVLCVGCQAIGHMISACRKMTKEVGAEVRKPILKKPDVVSGVSKDLQQDIVINLKIDKRNKNLDQERVFYNPGLDG